MRPKNKRVDKSGGRENERGEKKGEEGKKQELKREDHVILKSIIMCPTIAPETKYTRPYLQSLTIRKDYL